MLQLEKTTSGQSAPAAYTATTAMSGDVFGTLINLSGRRRVTSQRVILYAVLASMAHADALAEGRAALALFTDAHTTLIHGKGNLPGVFSDDLRQAYFGPGRADARIQEFITLAQQTLDAIESNARPAPILLDRLVKAADPMLALFNHLTLIYEQESQHHAAAVKRELADLMRNMKSISNEARMVSVNAQIVAARAGAAGNEFSVVARALSEITGKIDGLAHIALQGSGTALNNSF